MVSYYIFWWDAVTVVIRVLETARSLSVIVDVSQKYFLLYFDIVGCLSGRASFSIKNPSHLSNKVLFQNQWRNKTQGENQLIHVCWRWPLKWGWQWWISFKNNVRSTRKLEKRSDIQSFEKIVMRWCNVCVNVFVMQLTTHVGRESAVTCVCQSRAIQASRVPVQIRTASCSILWTVEDYSVYSVIFLHQVSINTRQLPYMWSWVEEINQNCLLGQTDRSFGYSLVDFMNLGICTIKQTRCT